MYFYFTKKIRADLESIGFKVNPYDPCIAKRIITGKQMTIIWNDKNLKISHCDGWESQKKIKWLKKIYWDIKVRGGQKHHYLGIMKVSMI